MPGKFEYLDFIGCMSFSVYIRHVSWSRRKVHVRNSRPYLPKSVFILDLRAPNARQPPRRIENVTDTFNTLFEPARERPRHSTVSNKYTLKYISRVEPWSCIIRAILKMNLCLVFVLCGYFFACTSGMLYRRDDHNVLKAGEVFFKLKTFF